MKVAFDSRPVSGSDGVGRYSRCLLEALQETAAADDEIVATQRPATRGRARGATVLHSPWIDGAMLHSPCPAVVTVHDLTPLRRRSERLRSGGLHQRLRRLALQRASHVIVLDEIVADEVVAELGLEREHVVVIPPALSWEEAARATWVVYARAAAPAERSQPVVRLSKRPAA